MRIVKLRRGPRLALSTVSFHVHGNPSQRKRTLDDVVAEIKGNWSRYTQIVEKLPDANVPLDVHVKSLAQGTLISSWLVLYAAAAVYSCDFVNNSLFDHNVKLVHCPGIAIHVFKIWEDESGISPCVRTRGLCRRQDLELRRKRNRTLYYADTSRLASEVFKGEHKIESHGLQTRDGVLGLKFQLRIVPTIQENRCKPGGNISRLKRTRSDHS
ncbi:hypothetical protein ACOME3_004656 [Neoechinorhynchus agilis]